MTQIGEFTYPEITSQPAALKAAFEGVKEQQDWMYKYLCNAEFDEIVFIGSGSSYYQALVMASTARKWAGLSAVAYPSSEIFLFLENHALSSRTYLLVGVSRSGSSTEVLLALESVKDLPNWKTCGITCYEQSKMAAMTECLVSPLGKENSTVMTKSFSSMIFMMQVALGTSARQVEFTNQLQQVIAMDKSVVERADNFIQDLLEQHHFDKFIYLGMSTYFGLAQEACLKVKEMANVWTESYGTLEFRHGPKSIVEPGTLVCLLLSETARDFELKVAEEMQAYGAFVLLVTAAQRADTSFADAVFEVGAEHLSDDARSVLYMPILQYLGYYTAVKKGVNPDSPRNLTQVVEI